MTSVQSPARRVAIAGVVGALYVVLSLAVTPIAFGQVQFRLGEALKPLVIEYPVTIPAFGIGSVIINLFSSFAGVLELVFMPLVDVTGGVLCYLVARRIGGTFGTQLASLIYALYTAAGVGVVLTVAAGLPYLAAFAWVAVSEVVLLLLGNALLVRLRALPSGGLNVCVLPFIYVGVQEALDAMGAERDTGSRLVDRLSVLLR